MSTFKNRNCKQSELISFKEKIDFQERRQKEREEIKRDTKERTNYKKPFFDGIKISFTSKAS